VVLPAVAALAGLVLTASADRGSIPFRPDVEIFEPTQRAMIAWNGEEEILLLSTDLRASAPTKVLEVIPLPSEPEVKEGDIEAFKRAVQIINSRQRHLGKGGGRSLGRHGTPEAPAGEVTFHEKIGAHDISVTHVLDGDGFIEWVEAYLEKQEVENPTIPEPLKEVVNEYIEEGFTWFVFDVVELGEETKTNDAIQYRFKSDAVYYPLKITRTESGSTTVELLILTPRLLSTFPGYPKSLVKLPHDPVRLTARELEALNKDMCDLLDKQEGMKLRIWRITGKLSAFKADLVAR
jgi:hypothetical protein